MFSTKFYIEANGKNGGTVVINEHGETVGMVEVIEYDHSRTRANVLVKLTNLQVIWINDESEGGDESSERPQD